MVSARSIGMSAPDTSWSSRCQTIGVGMQDLYQGSIETNSGRPNSFHGMPAGVSRLVNSINGRAARPAQASAKSSERPKVATTVWS